LNLKPLQVIQSIKRLRL